MSDSIQVSYCTSGTCHMSDSEL